MIVDSVMGISRKALIDSCCNFSIITQQFFEKLPSEYAPIDMNCSRIWLATQNDDYLESYII